MVTSVKTVGKASAKIQKIPKQPMAIAAYKAILEKIICLEYAPNQHLEENHLVEQLGIGRTPIREALVRLQGEKMVESHPNKGVIVKPITLQNTKAMFESMHIFEFGVADVAINKDCSLFLKKMIASNKAVKKAILAKKIFKIVETNHEFHLDFAKCSRNEFLIRAVSDVRKEAKRLSYLSYNNFIYPDAPIEAHYDSVVEEHDQIIESLAEKNKPRIKQLLKEHIETFRQRIIMYMTS